MLHGTRLLVLILCELFVAARLPTVSHGTPARASLFMAPVTTSVLVHADEGAMLSLDGVMLECPAGAVTHPRGRSRSPASLSPSPSGIRCRMSRQQERHTASSPMERSSPERCALRFLSNLVSGNRRPTFPMCSRISSTRMRPAGVLQRHSQGPGNRHEYLLSLHRHGQRHPHASAGRLSRAVRRELHQEPAGSEPGRGRSHPGGPSAGTVRVCRIQHRSASSSWPRKRNSAARASIRQRPFQRLAGQGVRY